MQEPRACLLVSSKLIFECQCTDCFTKISETVRLLRKKQSALILVYLLGLRVETSKLCDSRNRLLK